MHIVKLKTYYEVARRKKYKKKS